MVDFEVGFAEQVAEDDDVCEVLYRMRGADEDGRWRTPEHVGVERLLTGGESGTRVFEITIWRGKERAGRVLKVGPATDLVDEWIAYKTLLREAGDLCAPIEAASDGVLELARAGGPAARPGADDQIEGVIYNHAGYYAGAARNAVTTFETVVRDACAGLGDSESLKTALAAVASLGARAKNVFFSTYVRHEVPRSWIALNRKIGPDLVVAPAPAGSKQAAPSRAAAWVLPAGTHTTPPAGPIRLSGPRWRATPGALIGELTYGRASVELRVDGGETAAPDPGQCFSVTETRASRHARLIHDQCGNIVQQGEEAVAGDIRVPLPWTRLDHLLREQVPDRILALAHGDLNARNILLADGRPYLIDYAHTGKGKPILGDFAWLELDLLRRALGDRLSFGDVVTLQRGLALAGRVLDGTGGEHAAAIGREWENLLETSAPRLVNPFRILWAIRVQSRLVYPEEAGPHWADEYLTMLVIESNRTLKWRDNQPRGGVAASVAVAGAATEALDRERQLVSWPPGRLLETAAALVSLLEHSGPGALAAAAALISEIDRRGYVERGLESRLTEIRATLVEGCFGDQARILEAKLAGEHGRHIRLRAVKVDDPPEEGEVLALLRPHDRVVLTGEAGAGKSATAAELHYLLAASLTGDSVARADWTPRLPLAVNAANLAPVLPTAAEDLLAPLDGGAFAGSRWDVHRRALLALGGVTLIVDGLDLLTAARRGEIVVWIAQVADRYPRAPVVVCARGAEPALGRPRWHYLALKELGPDQAIDFVTRVTADREVGASLARRMSGLPIQQMNPELRLPLFLLLLTQVWSTNPTWSRGQVVQAFADKLTAPLTSGRADPGALAEQVLMTLAAQLVRDATQSVDVRAAYHLATRLVSDGGPGLVDRLVALGVLRRDGASLAFSQPVLRDHYAGRWLARQWADDPRSVSVGDPIWLEPCKLLFGTLSRDDPFPEQVIVKVLRRDPAAAVGLLRASPAPPRALDEQLLRSAEGVLRDADASPVALRDMAKALGRRRNSRARSLLAKVAGDTTAAPVARRICLDVLIRLVASATSTASRRRREEHMRAAVIAILAEPEQEELLVPAVQALGRLRVRGLELHLAELVTTAGPWKVSDAAREVLRELEVTPTPAVTSAYELACARRLADMEAELPAAIAQSEYGALQVERNRLLDEFAGPEHLGLLLSYRFRFGVEGKVAELLNHLPGCGAPPAPLHGAWSILTGPVEVGRWITCLADEDEATVSAAAHRLLHHSPQAATDLLARARLTDDDLRLLAAADAVPEVIFLEPEDRTTLLDQAEHLVHEVMHTRIEVLVALVCGIFAVDRLRGVRLAHRVTRVLADRGESRRHRWPWIEAFARCKGTAPEFERLLGGDEEDVEAAVMGLSGHGFMLDASPGPGYRFGGPARQRLLAALVDRSGSAEPGEVARVLCACAAAGLPEALPHALRAAANLGGLGGIVSEVGTNVYGLIEQSALADVLTVLGFLGQLAASAADAGVGEQARDYLRAFHAATTAHPTVALGRLVGLAYLGDWRAVLEQLPPDDPRAARIARNAVLVWAPAGEYNGALRWVERRLDAPGVPAGEHEFWSDLHKDLTSSTPGWRP